MPRRAGVGSCPAGRVRRAPQGWRWLSRLGVGRCPAGHTSLQYQLDLVIVTRHPVRAKDSQLRNGRLAYSGARAGYPPVRFISPSHEISLTAQLKTLESV
ncbi:hypothetical protein Poly21_56910 [Allorhodopirellula heiligendammensis]|uniref:Uncharacterized protein n=1 Tax=Allorhodopirellula heiligendammensis TaxID=2714739 RepID=A0A5C6B4H9_9BACT|nr:hypothetical protein Poly21_56910 [Allorhodopirellula heiligendammensis]